MESLNMNNLANSLPNSANAEKQLMDNFKAAALSITTLYRSSLDTSKRAYSAGYATCLLDVLRFVEAGVSVSGNEGEDMTIGRVMDWLEARLEAIKSTEEEEEEDRMKESTVKATQEDTQGEERRSRKVPASGVAPVTTSKLHRRSKENLHDTAQTTTVHVPSNRPPSSPPVAARANSFTSPSPPPPPTRPIKQKRGLKDLSPISPFSGDSFPMMITPGQPFTFSPDVVSAIPAVGSKRRHATMVAESPASSSVGAASPSTQNMGHNHPHGHVHAHGGGGRRKRARGAREREAHHGAGMTGNNNSVQGSGYADAMEVEDEGGRERKRPARR